jgi:hemolysin D
MTAVAVPGPGWQRWFRRPAPDRRDGPERAFLPAALEIVETPASPTARLTAFLLCAVFTLALAWSWLGWVDIIAVASGKVIAESRTKVVQPFEIGTVRAIHVRNGQRVKAGDLLIDLDATAALAERERAGEELQMAQLDIARLSGLLDVRSGDPFAALGATPPFKLALARSHLAAQRAEQQAKLAAADGTIAEKEAEIAGIQANLAKIALQMPLALELADIRDRAVNTGYGAKTQAIEAQQRLLELKTEKPIQQHRLDQARAAVVAARFSRAQAEAEYTKTLLLELDRAHQQAAAATEILVKARQRVAQARLVAPVDGVVEDLSVHTLGGVVTPAQQLFSVVPDGGLEVEAEIDNRDIGFVATGQPAEIKIEAFPFTRYGLLSGVVTSVAQDAVPVADARSPSAQGTRKPADDPQTVSRSQQLAYSARIALDRATMAIDDHTVALVPGMAVTVEIKTGTRRVLDYLLSPLKEYAHQSLRER